MHRLLVSAAATVAVILIVVVAAYTLHSSYMTLLVSTNNSLRDPGLHALGQVLSYFHITLANASTVIVNGTPYRFVALSVGNSVRGFYYWVSNVSENGIRAVLIGNSSQTGLERFYYSVSSNGVTCTASFYFNATQVKYGRLWSYTGEACDGIYTLEVYVNFRPGSLTNVSSAWLILVATPRGSASTITHLTYSGPTG